MPIEYVRDPRTGKLVAKGSLGFGQAVVPEAPPRPRQPAKPRPSKPKQPGIFGFGANGFSLDKLGNDLRYELNQLRSDPVRSVQRAVATRPEAQIALGGATALSNAARAVIEYKQKASGRPKADYTTSPVGRAVDAYEDTVFRALNQTPPSQMTGQEKAIRDMRGSVTLAVATSLGGGALLNAARGVRFIGPAAQALSNITNPGNATTAIGAVGRVAADAVVGELASTPLDDNTGGSAAGLVDMVLGTKLDPVKPGMDRPEAAAAAFGPNALAGFALAGPLVGLGRWAGHARARSAQRAAQPVQQARAELEAAGLTQTEPESGVSAFTPEATQGAAPTLSEVNAALEVKYGIRPAEPAKAPDPAAAPIQPMEPGGAVTAGKLPTADPAVDPWNVDYDPALPEADVALTLVKNASDNELLDALRGDGALLDQLDQTMANRLPVEPDPALSTELTAAPTDNLAPPITPFADQWKRLAQKDPNALLAVLHPDVNPGLAERAQAMFGRGWEDLTPQDAVDTLQAAAADGMTVMPNRLLPGQQIMRTSDIKPGPKLERAPGSTLKDASQWDNELEGVVDVWKDPASGNYFAVNGRSRLDLAKRTGVNSLVVREVQADSLEQARQLSLQDENAVLTPDAAEPQAAPDGSAIDQPQQLAEVLPEDRPALELAAIQRAIQNGEVRPPETPIPDMPADSGVNLLKVQRDLAENTITDDVVQALDDELALREQFKQIDQVVAQETEKAARDAVGYDLLTFEEKKQAGMLDGIRELDSPAGWDSIDNSPFNPDPQESLRRQEELRQIIREVAGDEVTMRFQDHYETVIKSPEWGGDGKATTTRGGFYRLLQDLIQVNGVMHDTLGHTGLAPSRVETAYHESFHRLQYIALSPEEASILNGNWARIKVGIGSGHLLVKKPIAYSESQAVAFQRYAAAKRAGADPVAAMLGSYRPDTNAAQKALGFVVSAFDRILDVAEKLYNGLTKGTFDSTRAIFERARRGDLAQADNWEGPGGMTNPGSGMDMMDRPASEYGWRRSSAFKESLRGGGAGDLASPGPSPGQLFDDLNSVLGDPDPRTGMVRGLSKSAVKQALNGDASRALSEGMQLAETRLSDLNARIEAVKQRAAQEGC